MTFKEVYSASFLETVVLRVVYRYTALGKGRIKERRYVKGRNRELGYKDSKITGWV